MRDCKYPNFTTISLLVLKTKCLTSLSNASILALDDLLELLFSDQCSFRSCKLSLAWWLAFKSGDPFTPVERIGLCPNHFFDSSATWSATVQSSTKWAKLSSSDHADIIFVYRKDFCFPKDIFSFHIPWMARWLSCAEKSKQITGWSLISSVSLLHFKSTFFVVGIVYVGWRTATLGFFGDLPRTSGVTLI